MIEKSTIGRMGKSEPAWSYADAVSRVFKGEEARLSSFIVHGSYAFGDAIVGASDLDVLVVAEASRSVLGRISSEIQAISPPSEAPSLELSIVSMSDMHDLSPSRPFRLHLNLSPNHHRVVDGVSHAGDQDLTLHYAVSRECGVNVLGLSATEVIPAQPDNHIAQAMASELKWASRSPNTAYGTLNACRAIRFATDRSIVSKLEGWLWARRNGYNPKLLDSALGAHLQGRGAHDFHDGDMIQTLSCQRVERAEYMRLLEYALEKLANVANTRASLDD